jgi:hypothetical protein
MPSHYNINPESQAALLNAPRVGSPADVAFVGPNLINALPDLVKGLGSGGVGGLQDILSIIGAMGGVGFGSKPQGVPSTDISRIGSRPFGADDLGRRMGADVNSNAFLLGDIGAPDPKDAAVVGAKLFNNPQLMSTLAGMTAFHGSPHKFDKFDMKKIGTGEGLQAYGHGLYFAESKGVAGSYKGMTSILDSGGSAVEVPTFTEHVVARVELGNSDNDYAKARKGVKEFLKNKRSQDRALAVLDEWEANGYTSSQGNLYDVDIPDESVAKMLDWDKPLSEQPESVQTAIRGLAGENADKVFATNWTGKDFYQRWLGDSVGSGAGEKTSALLNEAGIPGIKYLDGSSRNTAGGTLKGVTESGGKWKAQIEFKANARLQGSPQTIETSMPFDTEAAARQWADKKINEGTRNLVLFDENLATITSRNGEKVGGGELGSHTVKKQTVYRTARDQSQLKVTDGHEHGVEGISTSPRMEDAEFYKRLYESDTPDLQIREYEVEGEFVDYFELFEEAEKRFGDDFTEKQITELGKELGYVGSYLDDPQGPIDYRVFDAKSLKPIGRNGEKVGGAAKSPKMTAERRQELLDKEYRHEPALRGEGEHTSLDDVAGAYGDDIYRADAADLYGRGFSDGGEAVRIIQANRGNPNARIKVYRSVPKGSTGDLKKADWVSTTRKYAEDHGERNFRGDYDIIESEVYADELFSEGNGVHEWGYDPRNGEKVTK